MRSLSTPDLIIEPHPFIPLPSPHLRVPSRLSQNRITTMAEEEKHPPPPAPEEKKEQEATPAPEDGKKKTEEPVPPPEIILKVFMHCEGCAKKVRRCLKGFEGVEEVITDCRSSKVVVKGEKADPLKVLERVQKKSHRKVELISPIPKPSPEKPPVKAAEVKEEEAPPVVTVVVGVFIHCEACAQEIKRRIQKMKGVESAEPDLKSSQVKVKGVFDPVHLADYVQKRTGKRATIVKVDKASESEAKKGDEKGGGEAAEEDPKVELKKNELYYESEYILAQKNLVNYHPEADKVVQVDNYPPQMFNDENPNACSVM